MHSVLAMLIIHRKLLLAAKTQREMFVTAVMEFLFVSRPKVGEVSSCEILLGLLQNRQFIYVKWSLSFF